MTAILLLGLVPMLLRAVLGCAVSGTVLPHAQRYVAEGHGKQQVLDPQVWWLSLGLEVATLVGLASTILWLLLGAMTPVAEVQRAATRQRLSRLAVYFLLCFVYGGVGLMFLFNVAGALVQQRTPSRLP